MEAAAQDVSEMRNEASEVHKFNPKPKQCDSFHWGDNCVNECNCGDNSERCSPRTGCICKTGFTGASCENDTDECLTIQCGSFQDCVNTPGSYRCECQSGYQLSENSQCTDVDECSELSLNDCDVVSTNCVNVQGNYSCDCRQGYRRIGSACVDIDECVEGTHVCQQECENSIGGYNCECLPGYVLEDDRITCFDDDKLCEKRNITYCDHACTVENQEPKCVCFSGYNLVNTSHCEDIDECMADPMPCSQSCNNTVGSFSCGCQLGYKLANDGKTCEVCDAFHWGLNCATECGCGAGAFSCNNTSGCVCKDGWKGDKCDVDIQECSTVNICGNLETCTELLGSYRCDCNTGYQKSGDSCEDIDECASSKDNECAQACVNTVPGYSCDCWAGFKPVTENRAICIDIDECEQGHDCEQLCDNTAGSYRCNCKQGFTTDMDRFTCVKDLATDPCNGTSGCEYGCELVNQIPQCYCSSTQILREDKVTCRNVAYNIPVIITLEGLDYTTDLDNKGSDSYKLLRTHLQQALKVIYAAVPGFTGVIVRSISNGSLIVQHDVILNMPVNPQRMESVRQALHEASVMSVVIRVDTTNTTIVGVPVILGVNGTQYDTSTNVTCDWLPCGPEDTCLSENSTISCVLYILPPVTMESVSMTQPFNDTTPTPTKVTATTTTLGTSMMPVTATTPNITTVTATTTTPGTSMMPVTATTPNRTTETATTTTPGTSMMPVTATTPNRTTVTATRTTPDTSMMPDTATTPNITTVTATTAVSTTQVVCPAGQFRNAATNRCVLCASGTYQSLRGQSSCLSCPSGTWTPEGTTSNDQCVWLYSVEDGTSFKGDDQLSESVQVENGLPVANSKEQNLFISPNGYVVLGQRYSGFTPKLFPIEQSGMKIIAPFWADSATSSEDSTSVIMYKVYSQGVNTTKNTAMLARIESDVWRSVKQPGFTCRWAIVVEWRKVKPYPAEDNPDETNTFQLVLATDFSKSYALFKYDRDGMLWDKTRSERKVVIGFQLSSQVVFNSLYSEQTDVFRINSVQGNTGFEGFWIYSLEDVRVDIVSYEAQCLTWYDSQQTSQFDIAVLDRWLPACPCTLRQMFFNPQFISYLYTPGQICFISRLIPQGFTGARECCYSTSSLSLDLSADKGGHLFLYHPLLPHVSGLHQIYDKQPLEYCCVRSGLCQLYTQLRPVSQCFRFVPFRLSFFWGDPHIQTLDKKDYTFNGWGEYTMLELLSGETTAFVLQARTGRVKDGNGNFTNATIFTGFAVKDYVNTANVQIELSNDRKGLLLYVDGEDYSLNYRDDRPFPFGGNVSIVKLGTSTLSFSFLTGLSFNVSVGEEVLDITLTLPGTSEYTTRGLLGVSDGDVNNDFTLPNGTILDINSTEEEIYYRFGQQWMVDASSSVFTYRSGESVATYQHPDHRPLFLSDYNATQQAEARIMCRESLQCIYDYLATLKPSLALRTRDLKNSTDQELQALENVSPQVFNVTGINGTVGSISQLTIQYSDADSSVVTVSLVGEDISGLTLTSSGQGSAQVNWTPESIDPVIIRLQARDDQGGVSPEYEVPVRLCSGCNNQGSCVFSQATTPTSNISLATFQLVRCECQEGWTGSDCEQDYNICMENPCPEGASCTDYHPSQTAEHGKQYECGDCPTGYTLNVKKTKCLDVDECAESNLNTCSQMCKNTLGGYICQCSAGYRLIDGLCINIDECQERTSGCEQICTDEEPSYRCGCNPGFFLSDDKHTCTKENNDPCSSVTHKCEYGCKLVNGAAQCFCALGYRVEQNGTCSDIDECKTSLCSAICENTPGSFTCSCNPGYKLASDGLACEVCDGLHWGDNCRRLCTCSEHASSCSNSQGCLCKPGWTGEHCDEDVKECDTASCGYLRHCIDTPGSYRCQCMAGYKEEDGQCRDIDECSLGGIYNCTQDCQNTMGSFQCTCAPGYQGDGQACTNVDECATGIHRCQHKCVDVTGSYNCECYQGYALNDDRFTCTQVATNCDLNCDQICNTESTNATCDCFTGYERKSDRCEDIDECKTRCDGMNMVCKNTVGRYNCSCNRGYKLNADESQCEVCDSFHWGDGCETLCNCGQGSSHCNHTHGCVCKSGWTGTLCDTDILECESQGTCPQGETCVELLGSYKCACPPNYKRENTSCVDIDECTDNSHDCVQNCINTMGGFTCSCFPGYRNVYNNGSVCQEINECMEGNVCNQICTNIEGGYLCSCHQGFTLDSDNQNCSPDGGESACVNHTENCEYGCHKDGNSQTCFCPAGQVLQADNATCQNIRYEIRAVVVLNLTLPDQDKSLKTEIQASLYSKYVFLENVRGVIVTELRSGSVIVDHVVQFNKDAGLEETQAVVSVLKALQFVQVFGQKIQVTETPEIYAYNSTFSYPVTQPISCDWNPCPLTMNSVCVSLGTNVTCTDRLPETTQTATTATPDSRPLDWRLGLAIGVPMLVSLIFLVFMIVLWCRSRDKGDTHSLTSTEHDPYNVRDAWGSWGTAFTKKSKATGVTSPFFSPFTIRQWQDSQGNDGASGNEDLFSSQRHQRVVSASDVIRYTPGASQQPYQVEGVSEESGNYSWDYVFKALSPDETFHIKRPVVRREKIRAYQTGDSP
ncbi:uncharacterized protein LOC135476257 [Liolophura sinensis]|uniref:uncharacterized protein LOC135476257 n=1 Tax=Liolophura sinensis TaxID=3198878 RepID=UPI003158D444